MPSPRELSEMIVNAQYTPNSPNVDECVNELLAYLSSRMRSFPRKTAEAQIRATIRLMETKDEREAEEKEKNLKKKNEILSFARLYLIHLHDLNSRKTQLSYELQIHFKISAARAEKIAQIVLDEFDRIYSFAINHIPQYFDTAALINPDELKEAILRNFSIEERVAGTIAHKAIREYQEATNTTPEFQTYEITESQKIISKPVVEKTEEVSLDNAVSTPESLEEIEKKKEIGKPVDKIRKPPVILKSLQLKYIDIIKICEGKGANVKQIRRLTKTANSTIADRVKRLIEWGYLYQEPNVYP
ncbi:MAG: hypothetical protein EAX86_13055, partial [Candidatus Heimdallarchaeota archaeon]|nr:hypothetical protein [Candidatus Heimdallarchaeota archaeon]